MALFEFDGYIYTDEFDRAFPGYRKKEKYVMLHIYTYWLHYGIIPERFKTCVHHLDVNKKNNEINNLKLITLKEHRYIHSIQINQSKNYRIKSCSSKFPGSSYKHKDRNPWRRVWRSAISYNGKNKNLGYFEDPISAMIVYELVREEITDIEVITK